MFLFFRGMSRAMVVAIVAVIAVVVGLTIWGFIDYNHQQTRVITVCSKERVATDNGGEYRIYGSNETFVMKDNLIGGVRFDTSTAYSKVEAKTTYRVTLKGWRIPLASEFQNIIAMDKLSASEQTPQLCES